MTKLTFITDTGEHSEVDIADGTSIMRGATLRGVPGIIGECGGEMSCATCHIYAPEEISSLVPPPTGDELELLETSDHMTDESRLSCQVRVRPEFEGAAIRIPPQT